MTTVFLVRHAAHGLVDQVLCGRSPGVALGPEGRLQVDRLAARFEREPVTAIYTSPLQRAQETAHPIAARLGLRARVREAINEIDFGAWTGRRFEELQSDPRWRRWNERRATACTPGGESMVEVQGRSVRLIEEVCQEHPDSGVLLVSHGDVIKAIVCAYLGVSLDRHACFEISPGSVTAFAVGCDGARLMSMNERGAWGGPWHENTMAGQAARRVRE